MRIRRFVLALGALAFSLPAFGDSLPSDVKSDHWAASAVQQVVKNNVMSLMDGKFRGDGIVTHSQAAIALAKLARALEGGSWMASSSRPVSEKVVKTLAQGTWEQRPVTRYALASALARMGNYVANGVPRPATSSTDLGKSSILPSPPTITTPRTDPAYESLTYLANKKMLWPGSPLLKTGSAPIKGAEISRAIKEMTVGLVNRLTELGHDEDGGTIDVNSKRRKQANPGKP